jgi:flagellar biosynthetic protein FliP
MNTIGPKPRTRLLLFTILAVFALSNTHRAHADDDSTERTPATARANAPVNVAPNGNRNTSGLSLDSNGMRQRLLQNGPTVLLFALASLVPAAVLMVTAFVRISIVLTLLRQALGSPQIPGNQVLMALALSLTALIMQPVGERVYRQGIEPFASGRLGASAAWEAGTGPIKEFMIEQICRTHHEDYLWQLHDYAVPKSPGQVDPTECEQFPLRIIAPAFLLSELTTALVIGFVIYLPFLVIDLVVSSVLAAMGLFMTPPSLIALPLKLVLFVLADGWMLVAGTLLRSFGTIG